MSNMLQIVGQDKFFDSKKDKNGGLKIIAIVVIATTAIIFVWMIYKIIWLALAVMILGGFLCFVLLHSPREVKLVVDYDGLRVGDQVYLYGRDINIWALEEFGDMVEVIFGRSIEKDGSITDSQRVSIYVRQDDFANSGIPEYLSQVLEYVPQIATQNQLKNFLKTVGLN